MAEAGASPDPSHYDASIKAGMADEIHEDLLLDGVCDPAGDQEEGTQQQDTGLVAIVKGQVEVPVQELLLSELYPAAEGIQQDIALLLQDINATQSAADSEKAAIDSELQRIQQLVRSFQEHMNALMGVGLGL